MLLAVIPLVVWVIIVALGGAGLGGGTVVLVQKWPSKGSTEVQIGSTNTNGVVEVIKDPMVCVDLYYRSVLDRNHEQYQFCVLKPLPVDAFNEKAAKRKAAMESKGIRRISEPVRGRTDITKRGASKVEGTIVFAISPWNHEERKYKVVRYGQGWKIHEEE